MKSVTPAFVAGLLLLSAAGGTAHAAAKPLRFTLEVSPMTGGPDDVYTATVQIEIGGVSGPDRYWHPDFGDFEVVGTQVKQGTSSVIDPAHGQQIRTVIIRRYELKPKRNGRLRIRGAKLKIGRDEHQTDDVWVQVGRATAGGTGVPAAPPSGGGTDPTAVGGIGVPGFVAPDPKNRSLDMFLHVVADKSEVYLGEQVTVTWMLYTRSEVLKFEPKPPSLDGLWTEILYEPDAYFTYHEDVVGGTPFVVAIVSKRALFPTETGRLEIKPFRARVASLSTSVGRSRDLTSRAIPLTVKPLPPGAPPGFDPTYVGSFEVKSSVDRNEIDASESLTLTVEVSGIGAIRRTQPPKLAFPGFTFRAPRDTQDTIDTSTGTVRGERIYRYWTTPEQGGALIIPAVQVPFFDPRSGKYEVARSRPIEITVKGDPSKIAGHGGDTRENVIPRDIRLIHGGEGISSRTVPRLYKSPWFWPLLGVAPLAFVLVIATDRVRQRLKKDTPRARLRRARGRARKRFRVAEIHIRGNRPAKFFGELARVLYDHIEERTGQSVLSMTRDELRGFLKDRGFEPDTIQEIDQTLETFDFARFAPSAAGPGEMRAQMRKLRDLLRTIEKTRLVQDAEEAA